MSEEVREGAKAPEPDIAQASHKDPLARTPSDDSLDAAVSKLLRKPAQATPEVEPEAELEETEEVTSEDEVEDDESETQTNSEETEEESEEESEEQEGELYFSVKIDGEEYEVSADELKSGYQRQKDYTKKTQALAEQRKEYEAQIAKLNEHQEAFLSKAQMADQLLNRDLKKFEKVDWEQLKQDDPVGYVQKQIEVQDIRRAQSQLHEEAQRIIQFNQESQQEAYQKQLEAERKRMLEVFPEWKSQEKATAHQAKIIEYAKQLGYTDQELSQIASVKALIAIDKARKYDELQSTKKGITKKVKPTIRKLVKTKGTPAKGAAQRKVQQEGRERLRKSGSLRDAAALMYEMQNSKAVTKPK